MSLFFRATRVFDGRRFAPALADVAVAGGVVTEVGADLRAPGGAESRSGGVLFPGFVDAHVHLSFSDPASVARAGVTSVIDLGAPPSYAFTPHPPLRFFPSGPLLTAPGGYPTRSWGANGYGLEVEGERAARDAVASLVARGAAVIKVAIEPREGPLLPRPVLRAIVDEAHEHLRPVLAHALTVEAVREAADAEVDALAHAPVERLPGGLVHGLGTLRVAVISTVRAFGGSQGARENLAALAGAGCRVVYGTDLGNGDIRPGLDIAELEILERALGGTEAAIAAATSAAGHLARVGGRIAPGERADLVWVRSFERLADLAGARHVWIGGERVR